jgi:hypothetical protein
MLGTRRSIVVAALVGAAGITLGTGGVAVAATTLTARLSGQAEIPAAGNGTGSATITLKRKRGQICYAITLKGVGSVAAGHIHKGGKTVAGPIAVPLFDEPTTKPSGCVSAQRSVIRAIKRHPRRYYVNVHNARYPAGAARGQLHG